MINFGYIIAPETPEGDYRVGVIKEELKQRGIEHSTIYYKDMFWTIIHLPENTLSPETLYVGDLLYQLKQHGIIVGMAKVKNYEIRN